MEEEDSEPLEEIPMEPVDPMEQLMLFWDLNHELFQEPQEMWNLHLKEMFTKKKEEHPDKGGTREQFQRNLAGFRNMLQHAANFILQGW